MATDILMDSFKGETRLAVMEDGKLVEFLSEREDSANLTGSIYLGRVENVLPGMNAAFVDIGMEKNGFLHAGDMRVNPGDFGAEKAELDRALDGPRIEKLARRGSDILVQVLKEPGGTKGPRLSCHIAMPGRLTVLLPGMEFIGVSRKIRNGEERARLRDALSQVKPPDGGVIARTAAEGASVDELRRDMEDVRRLWEGIQRRARTAKAPVQLYSDDSLPLRCVRDMVSADTRRVIVEGEALWKRVNACAQLFAPELTDRLERYDAPYPLMERYRLSHQLARARERRVWLDSGGFLVFDSTEALTAIDVNTGKFTGGHSLEDTVFQINCEAADEIARQLRLRDIGGIIVIDFIDMESPERNDELTQRFRRALKQDRAHTNVMGLSPLGLMEMTRKRRSRALNDALTEKCDQCQGTGRVLRADAVARMALGDLRARVAQGQNSVCLIECAPAVAAALEALGGLPGVRTYVRSRGAFRADAYDIVPAPGGQLPAGARELAQKQPPGRKND